MTENHINLVSDLYLHPSHEQLGACTVLNTNPRHLFSGNRTGVLSISSIYCCCLNPKSEKKKRDTASRKKKTTNPPKKQKKKEKQRPYKPYALKKDECFYSISLPETFIEIWVEAVKTYPVIALHFGLVYRCQNTS